jgi:hypothetical protein
LPLELLFNLDFRAYRLCKKGVNSMKEMNPDSIGCWIVCGVGCLAVCLVCIADGPVPIADVAGSTSGSKTSLASASFI